MSRRWCIHIYYAYRSNLQVPLMLLAVRPGPKPVGKVSSLRLTRMVMPGPLMTDPDTRSVLTEVSALFSR